METTEDIKKVSWLKTNWLFLLIGVIIVGYLGWSIWYWQYHPTEAGQFGDMFGVVTSILTFLSIILLIRSIRLQAEELQNSSKALKHSASELELTRKEFQKQNETSYEQLKTNRLLQQTTWEQRIEATFFNLIQLYQNAPKFRISDELNNIHYTVFEERTQNENYHLKKIRGNGNRVFYQLNDNSLEFITERYNKRDKSENVTIYYQIAVSVLEYLKEAQTSGDTIQKLVFIFRSILSKEELLILLYHMKLYKQYNGKFINPKIFDFAMKHNLFENIDDTMFPDPTFNEVFNIKRPE